ncbi:MAG TPA: hypothetical protein VGM69_10240 [Chloroflexota bacterium]
MAVRIVKVDELQFLTCLQHGLWGSNSARFKTWKVGDRLVFLVDTALAAVAEIAGAPFESRKVIWDNGAYPHRIHLGFQHALLPDHRPPLLGPARDALIAEWGPRYGWGIRNQQALAEDAEERVVGAITARPNDLPAIQANLDQHRQDAKLKRAAAGVKKPLRAGPTSDGSVAAPAQRPAQPPSAEDDRLHSQAQHALIELGKITGCSVWIAANDRSRVYKGKQLGQDCIAGLPNMGLSQDAATRIGLIDIIWLRQNAPLCAFEVEATTSIYSGLLRMSDLLAVVPAINIKLYLVVPDQRKQKAAAELGRPTFQKIGLNDFCRIITIEALEALLSKVQGFKGHVQASILDTIALPVAN